MPFWILRNTNDSKWSLLSRQDLITMLNIYIRMALIQSTQLWRPAFPTLTKQWVWGKQKWKYTYFPCLKKKKNIGCLSHRILLSRTSHLLRGFTSATCNYTVFFFTISLKSMGLILKNFVDLGNLKILEYLYPGPVTYTLKCHYQRHGEIAWWQSACSACVED